MVPRRDWIEETADNVKKKLSRGKALYNSAIMLVFIYLSLKVSDGSQNHDVINAFKSKLVDVPYRKFVTGNETEWKDTKVYEPFSAISTPDSFWSWLQGPMLHTFAPPSESEYYGNKFLPQEPGNISVSNSLAYGKFRVRQLRVSQFPRGEQGCALHPCYPSWFADRNNVDDFTGHYTKTNYTYESVAFSSSLTETIYDLGFSGYRRNFRFPSDEVYPPLGNEPMFGLSGFKEDFSTGSAANHTDHKERIKDLILDRWIGPSTREVDTMRGKCHGRNRLYGPT